MRNNGSKRVNKAKQHVTPKFYLDFFSFQESKRKPHIWIHDKATDKFFSDSTDNVGYVRNIYTLDTANNRYAWDDFYTYIVEPKMAELFMGAITMTGSMTIVDDIDIITEKQKAEMAMFIAVQIARGERFIDFANAAYDISSDYLQEYTGLIGDDKRIDIAEILTGKILLSRCTLFIHNRNWMFYYSKKDAFITSDEPVVFFDTRSNRQGVFECGLADSRTVICMPLSPKILLVMYHPFFRDWKNQGANGYDKKRVIQKDIRALIQKHNKGQINQSKRFVYGRSKEMLEQYLSEE